MKSNSGISLDNVAVAALPKHLLQFAVDQRYDDYSVGHRRITGFARCK